MVMYYIMIIIEILSLSFDWHCPLVSLANNALMAVEGTIWSRLVIRMTSSAALRPFPNRNCAETDTKTRHTPEQKEHLLLNIL